MNCPKCDTRIVKLNLTKKWLNLSSDQKKPTLSSCTTTVEVPFCRYVSCEFFEPHFRIHNEAVFGCRNIDFHQHTTIFKCSKKPSPNLSWHDCLKREIGPWSMLERKDFLTLALKSLWSLPLTQMAAFHDDSVQAEPMTETQRFSYPLVGGVLLQVGWTSRISTPSHSFHSLQRLL